MASGNSLTGDPTWLLENSVQPMWIFDQETLAFLEVNEPATRRYGYTRQEFLSMTLLDIRPVADVPKLLNATLHPLKRRPSQHQRWRHQAKDGTVFGVEITSYEVRFGGRPAEVVLAVEIPAADGAECSPVAEAQQLNETPVRRG